MRLSYFDRFSFFKDNHSKIGNEGRKTGKDNIIKILYFSKVGSEKH